MAENARPQLLYLRAWRYKRGYSQDELSALSGVTKATISRLESGSPVNFSTVGKLAEALGLTREQLLEGPPPSPGGD